MRKISHSSHASKIMLEIIHCRLEPYKKKQTGVQADFRKDCGQGITAILY